MKSLRFFTLFILLVSQRLCAPINFATRSVAIKVKPSGILNFGQAATGFNGTLTKLPGSTISGQTVTFDYGIFEDPYNNMFMSGVYDPSVAGISLSGNGFLNASNGDIVETLTISGVDNLVEGQPTFNDIITLQDASTTVTFAMQSRVNQNINLNNGTIYLKEDLKFVDNKKLIGPGNIHGNYHRLEIGGDTLSTFTVSLAFTNVGDIFLNGRTQLNTTFTFNATDILNGNGNVLEFGASGQIYIAAGATLNVADIVFKNVSNNSFSFADKTAQMFFSNVDMEFVNSVTFTTGGIYVEGPSNWIIKNNIIHFENDSTLTVDGMTLWKDEIGDISNLGNVTFATSTHLELLNSGTIKFVPSSTDDLQAQIDALKTDTGLLSTSTINLQIQIDNLSTDTTNLQYWIDLLDTSTQNLQIQVDAIATDTGLLSTSTISLQNQLDQVMTDTTNLQNWIDLLDTSTQNLQIQVDAIATDTGLLSTSTISLQNQIDAIATDTGLLSTSTISLQNQIDLLNTSTINLQNQIDAVATDTGLLSTSTISLQNQIDLLDTSTINLQNQIDAIATDTGLLSTSTIYLQDQIDLFTTSTINLQNQIDAVATDTGLLSTSTIYLQDQIDLFTTSTINLQNQIDALGTATQDLQDQIDAISTTSGFLPYVSDYCNEHIVTVSQNMTFNHQAFLSAPDSSLGFHFLPCPGGDLPVLTISAFDTITLPQNAKLIFYGQGIVNVEDGVEFEMLGTGTESSDFPPSIIVQNRAMFIPAEDAVVNIKGIGEFITRECGSVVLDQSCQLVFGSDSADILNVLFKFGVMTIADPFAYVSFEKGRFNIKFDKSSVLNIFAGFFELNANFGTSSPGIIDSFVFDQGSRMEFDSFGRLVLSDNLGNVPMYFDSINGEISGNGPEGVGQGLLRYLPADSEIYIQRNYFDTSAPVVNVFAALGLLLKDSQSLTTDAGVSYNFGPGSTLLINNKDGLESVFAPDLSGRTFTIQSGDHGFYKVPDKLLIRGIDKRGRPFQIDNNGVRTLL
ncbi:MAG: Adhesin [candidate division TM6 bacterium GW2011_GWF2_32_72]|nr:MAG: Adhesin [candidate division TM6 bacterium GW2011_GWF2_32_72]